MKPDRNLPYLLFTKKETISVIIFAGSSQINVNISKILSRYHVRMLRWIYVLLEGMVL